MSNPVSGVFAVDTPEKTYKIKFGVNAQVELEDIFDKPFHQLVSEDLGGEFRMKKLRSVVWAGLQDYQEGMSEKEAGTLIDQVGAGKLMEVVIQAIRAAYPETEDDGERKGNKKSKSKEKNAKPQTGDAGQLTS